MEEQLLLFDDNAEVFGEKKRRAEVFRDYAGFVDKFKPKNNCRWAKIEEQSWNKRHTVKLEYNGEQITLRDLCLKTGLKRSLLYARIVILGWDIEKAITTPVKK